MKKREGVVIAAISTCPVFCRTLRYRGAIAAAFAGDILRIEDMGSTNGTSVDGAKTHPTCPALQAAPSSRLGHRTWRLVRLTKRLRIK